MLKKTAFAILAVALLTSPLTLAQSGRGRGGQNRSQIQSPTNTGNPSRMRSRTLNGTCDGTQKGQLGQKGQGAAKGSKSGKRLLDGSGPHGSAKGRQQTVTPAN